MGGHGYDPCFQPKGESRTFAEMGAEKKHALSHRGRAMKDLLRLFEKA
jgi:XTP/dITP diphosphohydrolase